MNELICIILELLSCLHIYLRQQCVKFSLSLSLMQSQDYKDTQATTQEQVTVRVHFYFNTLRWEIWILPPLFSFSELNIGVHFPNSHQ